MQPEPSHPVRAGGLQGAPHPRRGGRHPAGRNHSRCAQCVPAALREQEGAHAAGQVPGRARRGRRARGVTARRLVRLRGVVCASGRRTRLPVLSVRHPQASRRWGRLAPRLALPPCVCCHVATAGSPLRAAGPRGVSPAIAYGDTPRPSGPVPYTRHLVLCASHARSSRHVVTAPPASVGPGFSRSLIPVASDPFPSFLVHEPQSHVFYYVACPTECPVSRLHWQVMASTFSRSDTPPASPRSETSLSLGRPARRVPTARPGTCVPLAGAVPPARSHTPGCPHAHVPLGCDPMSDVSSQHTST